MQEKIKLPKCEFCGHRCDDGCPYWNPGKKDSNGRTYCTWYGQLLLFL